MQAKLQGDRVCKNPSEWFEYHKDDYQKVLERLSRVRKITLTGDLEKAADIVKKAYFNAILSIQTDLQRHEKAYARWAYGNASPKSALLDTVYGGTKIHQWDSITVLNNTDWVNVVIAIREHVKNGRFEDLLRMCEHVKGVGFRKWSFVLAMSGIWELACVDSNVGNLMDIDVKEDFGDSPNTYLNTVRDIQETLNQSMPPFVAQWAIYDFERGEHARHMIFFNSVLGETND